MRSIYMLSLLETYISEQSHIPSMIVVEDPEMFLHPQLQKICSGILYRLSKKNPVIFKTHSPDLIFNFTIRQICQVVLDRERYSVIRKQADIGGILDDLGYGASDLLNVSFVFIVEGKQDKSRLPMLLEKYYSEMYDSQEDADRLPKVTRRNVLILKYYSFENYFLNPVIMEKLGIVESEDGFYRTLYEKWQEYLYRIRGGQQLRDLLGRDFTSPLDMKEHMEEIKTYMRGHNLFDLFYGPFKAREQEILKAYINMAPREEFKDILDAIDGFVYFDSRRKEARE